MRWNWWTFEKKSLVSRLSTAKKGRVDWIGVSKGSYFSSFSLQSVIFARTAHPHEDFGGTFALTKLEVQKMWRHIYVWRAPSCSLQGSGRSPVRLPTLPLGHRREWRILFTQRRLLCWGGYIHVYCILKAPRRSKLSSLIDIKKASLLLALLLRFSKPIISLFVRLLDQYVWRIDRCTRRRQGSQWNVKKSIFYYPLMCLLQSRASKLVHRICLTADSGGILGNMSAGAERQLRLNILIDLANRIGVKALSKRWYRALPCRAWCTLYTIDSLIKGVGGVWERKSFPRFTFRACSNWRHRAIEYSTLDRNSNKQTTSDGAFSLNSMAPVGNGME